MYLQGKHAIIATIPKLDLKHRRATVTDPVLKTDLLTSSSLIKCRTIIKELLAQEHINVTELARRIHLPQPTIHRLLTGKTEDPKLSTLCLIAEYFGVSLDQILGNTQLKNDNNNLKNTSAFSIPIISWQDATNLEGMITNLTINNWDNWLMVDTEASPLSFGLKSKRSMEPRFPAGSILIIDPQISPADGDLVIVQYSNTNEATIRELVLDGPKHELLSILNNSIKDEFNNEIILLGVVIQTRFSYK